MPLPMAHSFSISQNTRFFSLLEPFTGATAPPIFALPDLRDRTAIGVGVGAAFHRGTSAMPRDGNHDLTTDQSAVDFGGALTPYDNMQPSLALGYFIAPVGIYPPRSGTTPLDLATNPFVRSGRHVLRSNFTPTAGSPPMEPSSRSTSTPRFFRY